MPSKRSVGRDAGTGPLSGLIVIELGQYIAAPYAAMVLADLGARVIKVEPPRGDGIRTWGPHPGGESAAFLAYNRNKEGIVADLTSPEGAALVRAAIRTADIVIENNRPGVLERFGLDAAAVRAEHPSLIYCSITAYGTDSPYAGRSGFDLVIQGITGLIDVTGSDGAPPAKIPVPIVDGTASLHATTAILAAVHERARTGIGATIDISLQASAMTWMLLLAGSIFVDGEAPRRLGSAHPFAAPYQVFEAADGPFTIAVGNELQWGRLCGVLCDEGLAADPRFATNVLRAQHRDDLAAILARPLRLRGRAAWIAELSRAGVPCGPVNTLSEALDDPALAARGLTLTLDHPRAGTVKTIGNPIGWERSEQQHRRAPMHGEDTQRVVDELKSRSDCLGSSTHG